jgi:hypothetical protein
MVNMYKVNIDELHDVTIDGNLFICESVSPSESFRRRERNRTNILNGTQVVTKGVYVPLDVTFTTHVSIDPTRPDMYDNVFEEMMSKSCEVISPELGGKFNAQVLIKKEHDKYGMLKLTIQLIEIPDVVSRIPGEGEFIIPEDKLESEEDRLAREAKTKAKNEAKLKGKEDEEKLKQLKDRAKKWKAGGK